MLTASIRLSLILVTILSVLSFVAAGEKKKDGSSSDDKKTTENSPLADDLSGYSRIALEGCMEDPTYDGNDRARIQAAMDALKKKKASGSS